MAVSRSGNTILATADGDTIAGPLEIQGLKLIGGASGMTVNLKKGGSSGGIVWSGTVAANANEFDLVAIPYITGANLYVNVSAGSGTLYIYLK